MKILLELFPGILIWIVLSVGNKLIQAVSHRSVRLNRIRPHIPAVSFIVWVLYALWLLHRWFSGISIYPMVLFFCTALLVMLFVWFVLRDVIAGVIFSSRKQFHINHRIRFNNLSGKIIEKSFTHITMRTDNGDIARIPYSRLSSEVVPERSEDTASDYYRIHLSIPKNNTPEQLQAQLTRDVHSIPWASAGTAPVVQLKEQTETDCNFEVLIRSLNSRHAARVERILRNIYKDLN